jgi:thiopeptide-type bacteriocin biosynthesis protein
VSDRAGIAGLASSGFAVLRTPADPFDRFVRWSEDAGCAATFGEHVAGLRRELRRLASRPRFREALFLASTELHREVTAWLDGAEDTPLPPRAERSLIRYVARSCGRATPFGLFAACSIVPAGDATRLAFQNEGVWTRRTRLDTGYLGALIEALDRDPILRTKLTYRPNSSLYRAAGKLRYAEARSRGSAPSYHLVAVGDSGHLEAALRRAASGASLQEIAEAVRAARPDVDLVDALEFATDLVDSQILISNLEPHVTGPDPLDALTLTLELIDLPLEARERLREVRGDLDAIDGEPGAVPVERYLAIAKRLRTLPGFRTDSRLFQVDLFRDDAGLALGGELLDDARRAIELLWSMQPAADDRLARFRNAFLARYEQREIPLEEALDEDIGIGVDGESGGTADASAFLKETGIASAPPPESVTWTSREAHLLDRLREAVAASRTELELTPTDIDRLAAPQRLPLPSALAVHLTLIARSDDEVRRGDYDLVVDGAGGPSGARLLGRFCAGSKRLTELVRDHLRAEERAHPDCVFAEVVHLPEGRVGNVAQRPVLRDHEIPYLGRSGAPAAGRIATSDLLVSVREGRVVLRSRSLGREVVPRLTSAHNFNGRSLAVYRFLGRLQVQGVAPWMLFPWGALESSSFLPRVRFGRLILSRARWLVDRTTIAELSTGSLEDRFRAVQVFRARVRMPRFVLLSDFDLQLPVDLDNPLSVDAFLDEARGHDKSVIVEMLPGPDRLSVSDGTGHFVHELVLPFHREVREGADTAASAPIVVSHRSFAPGSEWLYAKLYCGRALADSILLGVAGPIARAGMARGEIASWFFIRYGDPDWHLRVRFRGEPLVLLSSVLPSLHAASRAAAEEGRVWRLQIDTYEREVERYGGPEGIAAAEALFHADSEAVLTALERLDGDASPDGRWQLALARMDAWIAAFGYTPEQRLALASRLAAGFAGEYSAGRELRVRLGNTFRKHRAAVTRLLSDEPPAGGDPLARPLATLRSWTQESRGEIDRMRHLAESGRLNTPLVDLVASLMHMSANRILRSEQRAHEVALYDFLARHYESVVSRARGRLVAG